MFLLGLEFLYVRWTKNLTLVDSLVMEFFIWTLYFVTTKCSDRMHYYTMLLEQFDHIHDYGCPKIQGLVKTDSSWICSSYPFRHKTRLHCAERKAKVYGNWAMQHLQILYVFIVFVFTTNLFLSTRHDFFYIIHFEKLTLRNR